MLQSTFDIDRMKSFDRDDDGVVTRDEYLAAVLVMLGQTDLETCDLILKYYDILDHDGDQVLTYEYVGRKSPLATKNLLEVTDGLRRPP